MDDMTIHLPSSEAAPAVASTATISAERDHEPGGNHTPAKRGRKSETPAERLERLQRQVLEAKQAVAEAERRRREIVGEAILAEGAGDSAFMARVVEILRRRVTAMSAKSDIAALLAK